MPSKNKISKKEKMLGSFIPVTPEFMEYVNNSVTHSWSFHPPKNINGFLEDYKASVVKGMDYALFYKNPNWTSNKKKEPKLKMRFFYKENFKQEVLRYLSNLRRLGKIEFRYPKKLKKGCIVNNNSRVLKLDHIFDLKKNKDISGITVFEYCPKTLQRKVVIPN